MEPSTVNSDTPPGLSAVKRFYRELKARKVRRRVTIYLSAAVTLLGAVNLFTNVYDLPRTLFDVALIVLLCGLPGVAVSTWIHGLEGRQKTHWLEVVVYSFFAVVAAVAAFRLVTGSNVRVTPTQAKSIAVLPFANLSDSKDDQYFSDGVTEDIITQLSKIADLTVISRTSTMRYKDTQKSVPEIGRELDVAYVLEGSLRRSGDRVRIVGQLIDVRSDKHLWAETYDRDIRDVFAIQSEVACSIAGALQAALSPAEITRIERPATANLDAYGYYLRGRDYYYRYTKDDNERAIEFFTKALTVDPRYALAYAGIGDAYSLRRARFGFDSQWVDSAYAMSSKAVALDPALAEGYRALGNSLEMKGSTREALQQYSKAVELNPNYALVVASIGTVHFRLGHCDEALPWMEKAVILQPGSSHYYMLVGLQYFSLGLDSAATSWLTRALSFQPEMVFPQILETYIDLYQGKTNEARARIAALLHTLPDEAGALDAAGDVELIAGRYSEAAQYFKKACEAFGFTSRAGVKLAYALLKSGRKAESEKITKATIATFDLPGEQYPEGSEIPYVLAEAYAIRGNADRSVFWLREAIKKGHRDYRWTFVNPLLENLRALPDAVQVLTALRQEWEGMRSKVMARENKK